MCLKIVGGNCVCVGGGGGVNFFVIHLGEGVGKNIW